MGGEGPYCSFAPWEISAWASRTHVQALGPEELDAAYERAKEFLMRSKQELVDHHSWHEADEKSEDDLFSLRQDRRLFRLPISVHSFLDPIKEAEWQKIFKNHGLFNARSSSSDYFIHSPAPQLSDTFYLLQVLLPGVLRIVRTDEIDDGEITTIKTLPQEEWMRENENLLEIVLGRPRYETMLAASADRNKAFCEEIEAYENDYHCQDKMPDLTACDSECGYCGHCDY